MSTNVNKTGESRVNIIQSVQTPLGFFTLVVLITEAILGLLAAKATGTDFRILVVSMIILMFMLVSIVAYLSRVKPSLLALDTDRSEDDAFTSLPEGTSAQLQEYFFKIRKENQQLKAELSRLTSLKARVWAALNQDVDVSMDNVLKFLDAENDPKRKDEIFSIVGSFLEEGRITKASRYGYGWFSVKK
jgi:hypothetical protein